MGGSRGDGIGNMRKKEISKERKGMCEESGGRVEGRHMVGCDRSSGLREKLAMEVLALLVEEI